MKSLVALISASVSRLGIFLSLAGSSRSIVTEPAEPAGIVGDIQEAVVSSGGRILFTPAVIGSMIAIGIIIMAGIYALNQIRHREFLNRRKSLYNGKPFLGIDRQDRDSIGPFYPR